MKTNKKFLTILTLCIALLLTACGATDAAGTDKTNESLTETGTVSTDSSNTSLDDLYQQENQIFADHEAVWNKVFGMMSKSGADPSKNYADYLADTVEANKDSFTEDELKTLTDDMETIRKIEEQIAELEQGTAAADHTAPGNNSEDASPFRNFSGQDFDGNSVDESLFSGNAVTVVNFWFTGCKPCVAELSKLNELNNTLKAMGGEVIGINTETFDGNEAAMKEAAAVLESQGAKYRNISIDSASDAGKYASDIMAFPTTILVDRNGNIVGDPMLGGIDNKDNYDSLMKQLEVDISLVETEKKNVTELLEDYVQNIHKNLEKIGRNSTIKIREKSIKMLKVILPVWEDNEKLYSLRLSDLVDEITEEGIRLFENNENAQEYIGRKVTSKNLYDTVVGTGNVQIQLYKIEEQREQQISWNQVAKNSGGEGFLSAFVILSSLLDYMRKDDSDIFMDIHEGKVLLMDNPFAQTNAEHLLKPLMNLADKTNTQLICLTGLGGESIYNRFDNIYVLNLIEAHLRNGIQYLRPEHKKGEEVKVETILPTHIEVEEMLF